MARFVLQERYGYVRERAEQEVERRVHEYRNQMEASGVRQMRETAATAARAVADTVKGPGGYLHATGMDRITGDVTGLIRRYPVSAVLMGLGIGLLVGRSLGKAPRTPAGARGPDGPLDAPRGAEATFEEIER